MHKVITMFLAITTLVLAADYYKLENIKRVEKDLYRDGKLYIVTKYCYHYTYGEEAILKWDGYSGEIIWDDGSTCDCEKIFKK